MHPDFTPHSIHHTSFSGRIILGKFDETLTLDNQIPLQAGISKAQLHECTIGDNCFIQNIQGFLSHCQLGSRVVLINCGSIDFIPDKGTGQGVQISALNEAGGRTITLFDRLSSNLAHILIHYRYRPALIAQLQTLINQYIQQNTPPCNVIGDGVQITNCLHFNNVCIGPHAQLNAVTRLSETTIASSPEAPARIESGVLLNRSVVGKGSHIANGAILNQCYVGESCTVGNHFSAENSLFFANCEALNGEAVSAVAGPFTVSHHKTTLLIAAAYSFYNAGSGTNKSNHHYKLGPSHQAILERGVKTGSNSYLLEPAHIGAFTLITGAHKSHPDTADFPFSYLIERNGDSLLMPAQNLKTIGLFRDVRKWQQRDKRPLNHRLDLLEYSALNPYTVCKMQRAIDTLEGMKQKSAADTFSFNGVKLMRNSADRAISAYQSAIHDYLIGRLIEALHAGINLKELTPWPVPNDQWIDVGGMFVPQSKATELLLAMESFTTLDQLESALTGLFHQYHNLTLQWSLQQLVSMQMIELNAPHTIEQAIYHWIVLQQEMKKAILSDAAKEFSGRLHTGYGLDAPDDQRWNDFTQVKGTLESHSAVKECHRYYDQRVEMAQQVKKNLN